MSESFLNGRITLHCGDCLDVLATLPENSLDSCVTDPPYHLVSIVKRFGNETSAPINNADEKSGRNGPYQRTSKGFMGKQWDGGNIAQSVELWSQVYRVLKPGAHLLAFGGTRTFHRMACAIEDAGFEIRDCIQWLYGSGFPKSHDISKGIDRAAGAKREVIGERELWGNNAKGGRGGQYANGYAGAADGSKKSLSITEPATDAARQWQGWGTALKPACEPIVLARKPLSERTVAANVLRWGTGAINVDGCRVNVGDEQITPNVRDTSNAHEGWVRPWMADKEKDAARQGKAYAAMQLKGRWPADVIHDGSEEVVAAFPQVDGQVGMQRIGGQTDNIYNFGTHEKQTFATGQKDSGSAARFFYTAKADSDDRLGSKHPTVKPLDLMQYLVRLVMPSGGTVLDCFSGTGTTGEAAWREGMNAVLIERESEYQADIRRRMALCLSGPDERQRESIKAKIKDKPVDHGPLFGAKN